MARRGKRHGSMGKRVRKRAESHGKRSTTVLPEGVKEYKPKKGTRRLSIIPYVVSDEKHPEEVPAGELWYERTYGIHFDVGPEEKPFLCPKVTRGLPCPICEKQKEVRKDPDADEDVVKALRPKERQLFNVIDMDDDEDEVLVLDFSYHLFGKQLEAEVQEGDEDIANFADVEGGKVLKVRWSEEKLGKNTFLEADRIDFKDRDDLTDKILDQAVDLDKCLNVPSYDELKAAFEGSDEEPEKEGKDDDDEPPRRRPHRKDKDEDGKDEDGKDEDPEPEPEPEPEEKDEKDEGEDDGKGKDESEGGDWDDWDFSDE